MQTRLRTACAGAMLLAGGFDVSAQEASPSRTARPGEVEGSASYETAKRQRDRVTLRGYACADPATTRIAAADIEQAVRHWNQAAPKSQGYVPPVRTGTVPMASYPKAQLVAGEPGAALVMILLRGDGSVEDARVACSTGDGFAVYARETAMRNRYRPGRLNDMPVPGVVFQVVTYAVEPD